MASPKSSLASELLARLSNVVHEFSPVGVAPPDGFFSCHETHSTRVLFTGDQAILSHEDADGLITDGKRPVAIVTADCLPVLIADETGSRVAAIHAGWRGLVHGILIEAVNALERRGSSPTRLVVAVGPAIRVCCYEVGSEVTDALQAAWGCLWKDR